MSQRARSQTNRTGDLRVALRRSTGNRFSNPRAAQALRVANTANRRMGSLGVRFDRLSGQLRRQSQQALATQRAHARGRSLRAGALRVHGGSFAAGHRGPTTNPSLNALLGTVNQIGRGANVVRRGGVLGPSTPPLLRNLFRPIPPSGPSLTQRMDMAAINIGVHNALRGRTSLFSGGTMAQFNNTFHSPIWRQLGGWGLGWNSNVSQALRLLGPNSPSAMRQRSGSSRPFSATGSLGRQAFSFSQGLLNPRDRFGNFINRPRGV